MLHPRHKTAQFMNCVYFCPFHVLNATCLKANANMINAYTYRGRFTKSANSI